MPAIVPSIETIYSMSDSNDKRGSAVPVGPHKSMGQAHVTSVLKPGEVVYDAENPDREWNEDEEVLAALGYKAEFKREFSLFTTFSVSFAVLGLLPSFASTLYYGMGYAGTVGMVWGTPDFLREAIQRLALTAARLARCHDWHSVCSAIDGGNL